MNIESFSEDIEMRRGEVVILGRVKQVLIHKGRWEGGEGRKSNIHLGGNLRLILSN